MLPSPPWKSSSSIPRFIRSRRNNQEGPMTRAEIAATIEEALVLANDTLQSGQVDVGDANVECTAAASSSSTNHECTTSSSSSNEDEVSRHDFVQPQRPIVFSPSHDTITPQPYSNVPTTTTEEANTIANVTSRITDFIAENETDENIMDDASSSSSADHDRHHANG